MPRNLSRREIVAGRRCRLARRWALSRGLAHDPEEHRRRSSSSPRARASRIRSSPARTGRWPGRADPDRDRQGARLRGRRLQGRPAVRPRQDRPVGRLRLRDHRRPDHPGHATRRPPISADGEKAFYDAIRGGKGFIGMHCATDTFGHHPPRNKGADDPYIQMIGGEFCSSRPASRRSRSRSPTPTSPAWTRASARARSSRSTTSGTP